MNTAPDAVTTGIAEWERTKALAREAIDRCKKAEDDASFMRGQLEAIKTTSDSLALRNKALTEENAELKMLLSDLGRRFLDVLENSKLSPFRKPGGIPAPTPDASRPRVDGGNRAINRPAPPAPATVPGDLFEAQLQKIAEEISHQTRKD